MKLVHDSDNPQLGVSEQQEMAIPSPAIPIQAPELPENFKDYPVTIGDLRSEKFQSGSKWTPRDMLIRLLTEIDSGRINPDVMVVVHGKPGESGGHFEQSSPNINLAAGMLMRAMHNMFGG